MAQVVKNLPTMQETWVWSLGKEDPLEKGMATHSSILAWRTPCTEEPGRLQSMGSQRAGHDWTTHTDYIQPIWGKNLKKVDICICITESSGWTPKTNTALLINYNIKWFFFLSNFSQIRCGSHDSKIQLGFLPYCGYGQKGKVNTS